MRRHVRRGPLRFRVGRGGLRFRRLFTLAVLAAAAGLVSVAPAQDSLRIAAIVNDEVISVFDLEARIKFAIVSSKLSDTPEIRGRLKDQILRSLIDERLRLQEATRLNIRVTEAEVNQSLAAIERRNKVPKGQLDAFLAGRGVERFTLESQVRATIAWRKLVRRRLRSRVKIGDDEVDETLARLKANLGTPQMRVAEIFVSVDSPEHEDEVLQVARRLVEQIRGGARFAALARQFSQSASAAVGGDLGWIQQGQLDQNLDDALKKMQAGSISPPIRTFGGYHILSLSSRRALLAPAPAETKVRLSQIALPLAKDAAKAEVAARMNLAKSIAAGAESCANFDRLGKKSGSSMSGGLGEVKVGDLPPHLGQVVLALEIDQVSEPIRTDSAVLLLMLCDREEPPSKLPDAEEVKDGLTRQRVDLLARRYMRDLRNQAFVDLRE